MHSEDAQTVCAMPANIQANLALLGRLRQHDLDQALRKGLRDVSKSRPVW
eukprot:CAMPEP_0170612124 /NCGR_PEP_ID=MMETSP0224-20130122/23556_1 /TAXON_ID=285029 /ORGANISM="Togula jolla, Strain CCCM 725" /LENGTH=49 /DNA_ID= /DNA_START= /DNA_END= /DNA_ORIENTATION=